MGTLAELIAREGITATVVPADVNPNIGDDIPGANHYRVTLRAHGRQMTVPWSQGPAILREPTAADVLDCLASDTSGYHSAGGTFEAWAAEYGYDEDSRKAERIFRAVERQAGALRHLLGDAYDELLWNTERE